MKDTRQQQLFLWLEQQFSHPCQRIVSLTGDAGFRRYFRFNIGEQSYIAVDSPNDKCNNEAFNRMQNRLLNAKVKVPEIIAFEQQQGFYCLADLGDQLLADKLTLNNIHQQYCAAIDYLPSIATLDRTDLPDYDAAFVQLELNIFTDWLLEKHLAILLTDDEKKQLQQCFDLLIDSALAQPKVVMHRDYHSRNLMWHNKQLAVIDFQDAVIGPLTYDIVSLLRDCYVKWPQQNISHLFDYYQQVMIDAGIVEQNNHHPWQSWFDLMGLQRHLKAAGIFARLHHRDGKSGYLADIPLTLSYIKEVSANYHELTFLNKVITNKVIPALQEQA